MISMPSRIRRARTLASLSQAELARRVGVKGSAVTQWESQSGTTPSVDHLAQIARETGVYFEWLATGRGPSRPVEGEFDVALVVEDYVRDELESRVLAAMRQLTKRKKESLVLIVELLAG